MKIQTADVFAAESYVKIGNQIYIVERHFEGVRDFTEAINTVVQNTVKRGDSAEKPVQLTAI